ncbi:MAG: GGDEF domain-containing protein [Acidobacteria bacterium]|nr:GGDEF domain-containing protein [Acidobacteriota bacterium]
MGALVELDLRKPVDSSDSGVSVWKSLAQNVLRLVIDGTVVSDNKDTAALRSELAAFRETFSRHLHPQEERAAAAECVKTCERYLHSLDHDRKTRESELMDMVAILREAAARMLGDSSDFNSRLESSADRFRMMTRLEDIRDLKSQLTFEVDALNRLVEEKKQRDTETLTNLSKRVVVLEADLMKAEAEASTDALTRLANRGAFDRTLAELVERCHKDETPLALAMVDVDHFKQINDTHGHPIGDRVLFCTADWLRNSVRSSDFVARYGGEEFAVILKGADLRQAETRLTQVLREIASRSYEYEVDGDARSVRFTVSCGVTQLTANDSAAVLIQRADQALYEAKQKGRNRVVARKPSRFARLLSMK